MAKVVSMDQRYAYTANFGSGTTLLGINVLLKGHVKTPVRWRRSSR